VFDFFCEYCGCVCFDVYEASPRFNVLSESAGVGFGVAVFAAVFTADVRVYAIISQTTTIQNRPTLNNPNKHQEGALVMKYVWSLRIYFADRTLKLSALALRRVYGMMLLRLTLKMSRE
jgi:hypothetical protein